jgi:hypothetical protein
MRFPFFAIIDKSFIRLCSKRNAKVEEFIFFPKPLLKIDGKIYFYPLDLAFLLNESHPVSISSRKF